MESYTVSPLPVNGAACNNNILFDRSTMNYYFAEEAVALDVCLCTAELETYFACIEDLNEVIHVGEDEIWY